MTTYEHLSSRFIFTQLHNHCLGNCAQFLSRKKILIFSDFFRSNLFKLVYFWTNTSNSCMGYFFHSILTTDFKFEVKKYLIYLIKYCLHTKELKHLLIRLDNFWLQIWNQWLKLSGKNTPYFYLRFWFKNKQVWTSLSEKNQK